MFNEDTQNFSPRFLFLFYEVAHLHSSSIVIQEIWGMCDSQVDYHLGG